MVGVSLGPLPALRTGTGEISMVDLSLGLPLGSQLEYPNTGADPPRTLMGAPLGLWFGSDMVWGLGISCVPTSGALIKYNKNLVRY